MEYTILMSVYYKDNPTWLKESIESILEQTVLPKQFIIVKDGILTEELNDIISQYEMYLQPYFTIISLKENRGLGIALNAGIEKADCALIARMDSDDIAMPSRCEKQLRIIKERNVDIISGSILEFDINVSDASALKILPCTHKEILDYAKRRNPFNHPCVMFKKEKVMQVGMYQKVHLFEDYDLWIRMLQAGAIGYNIKEPLLYMRAGTGMYKRRGGLKYLISGVKFRWHMHKSGFSGLDDFFISSCAQIIFAMMPNIIRTKGYRAVLRKK